MPTDQPGIAGEALCQLLLSPATLALLAPALPAPTAVQPQCAWASSTTLRILLPPASQIWAGDSIALRAAAIALAHSPAQPPFSSGTVFLEPPLDAAPPTARISGPSSVSLCLPTFSLSAAESAGGGSYSLSFIWSATASRGNLSALSSYIAQAGAGGAALTPRLEIPTALLPPESPVTFGLRVRSRLNLSSEIATHLVTASAQTPTVEILGSVERRVSGAAGRVLIEAAAASPCHGSVPLTFLWTATWTATSNGEGGEANGRDDGTDSPLASLLSSPLELVDDKTAPFLSLPPYSLRPRTSYRFSLRVGLLTASGALDQASTANTSVLLHVPSLPLVARISTADGRTTSTAATLRLDASASFDPDVPPTESAERPMRYEWRCAVAASPATRCIDALGGELLSLPSTAAVQLPAGTLPPGEFVFTGADCEDSKSPRRLASVKPPCHQHQHTHPPLRSDTNTHTAPTPSPRVHRVALPTPPASHPPPLQ